MVAPLSTDLVKTYFASLKAIDFVHLEGTFASMEKAALEVLEQSSEAKVSFSRQADMRYTGQGFEIQVALPDGPYADGARDVFERVFLSEYARIFGRHVTGIPIEIVNLRLRARGQSPDLPIVLSTRATAEPMRKRERPTYFGELGDFVVCPVLSRYALPRGFEIVGPAIVEEAETTVVIGPDQRGVIDDVRNLIVQLPEN